MFNFIKNHLKEQLDKEKNIETLIKAIEYLANGEVLNKNYNNHHHRMTNIIIIAMNVI